MTLNREIAFEFYEDDAGSRDPDFAIYPIKAVQEGETCRDRGRLSVASAATVAMTLPASYVNSEDLLCYFKVTGAVEFTIVSPNHAASVIYCNAVCVLTDQITSISVKGVEDSVIEYTFIGVDGVERQFT
jgi:hypothetical protein